MIDPNRKPWTYDEYRLLPEDGNRYEIIDGELLMTPAPKVRHQELVVRLIVAFGAANQRNGRLLAAPCDVYFNETNHVQPDVLFVSTERASIVTELNVQGAPDLIVEVLSESTRKQDEVRKRKLYERFGVGEYWIVDPELETVKVFRLNDQPEEYGDPTQLSAEKEDRLTTELLPGLELSLADLFRTS